MRISCDKKNEFSVFIRYLLNRYFNPLFYENSKNVRLRNFYQGFHFPFNKIDVFESNLTTSQSMLYFYVAGTITTIGGDERRFHLQQTSELV